MNRKTTTIAITLTLILLGFVCIKLIKIENRLNQLEMSTQSSKNELIANMNGSINEIKEALLPKNQLITSHNVEYGPLDQKTMKIPVTVTIIPTQFEKQTIVELKINDTRMTMADNGTAFTQTISVDLFKAQSIEVILTKDNIREVVLLEEPGMVWEKYTLGISGSYDGGVEHMTGSNQLKYAGDVRLDFSGNAVKATQVDIYSDLDGKKKLIATYPNLTGNQFVEKLNYEAPIKAGQFHSIYADIQDSRGLHYIYPLSEKLGINEKNEFIYSTESGNNGLSMTGIITEIRDSKGKLLFTPQNY